MYRRERGSDRYEISVLTIATGNVRDVAEGTGPSWSPDGSSLLYNWSDEKAHVLDKRESQRRLDPARHVVENCHFHHNGRWTYTYAPAILMQGVGIRVAHNVIHDHTHCGIIFAGNDHELEFNEIYRVATDTGDVGAIYSLKSFCAKW